MVRVSLNMRELANVFSFFSLRISTYVARYVDDNVRWSIDLSLWLIAFFLHFVVQIQSVYHTCLFLQHQSLLFFISTYNDVNLKRSRPWWSNARERERESCLFFRVRAESKKISGMKETYLCISDHCNKKRDKKEHYSHSIYFLRIRFYSHLVRLNTHILLRSSLDII